MYSFFEGNLVGLTPATAVVECHGVGYLLQISLQTYSQIKGSQQCKLHTHLVVREDALILFGFADESERHVFQQLITVSGVGPNTARLILSSLTSSEVIDAIIGENIYVLQAVKGIGAKSAQRIIVDLKDKINREDLSKEFFVPKHNTEKNEALSALVMLGFQKNAANKALDKVIETDGANLSVDKLIKAALKLL